MPTDRCSTWRLGAHSDACVPGSNWQDMVCQLCPDQHGAYGRCCCYIYDIVMAVDDPGVSSARAEP
jgi:hypothetical protein